MTHKVPDLPQGISAGARPHNDIPKETKSLYNKKTQPGNMVNLGR